MSRALQGKDGQPAYKRHVANVIKAGPALGAVIGAVAGAANKKLPGRAVQRALEGAGLGSFLGWAPQFTQDAWNAGRDSFSKTAGLVSKVRELLSSSHQGAMRWD